MTNVSIKIKDGHKLDGDGEYLGKDLEGTDYTFWKNMGQMNIPLDLAIKLENETPQRYEMVNRELAKKALSDYNISPKEENKVEEVDLNKEDVETTLDRVEKIISLNKPKQSKILKKNKDNPDDYPKEMDRVKRIILQRYDQ